MKRIKLLMVMILVLTLSTGCSVEYNLMIEEDTIKEEIIVTDTISYKRTKEKILSDYNKWYPTYVSYRKTGESIPLPNFNNKVDGIEYHDKKIENIPNGYKYQYTYNHDIAEYYDSYALASTFFETTIQNRMNLLVLKTDKESFLCDYDYFDSLKINIKINPNKYKLNYTNSKEIKDNTYSWNINRNNCNNSEIILTLNKITNDNIEEKVEQKKTDSYAIYIFCGILIIIIIVGYFVIKKYKEKLDDFDIDD